MRPHRQQPTRLPRPGDSPGKNTGVGCHFLLQCMKVKRESEFAQSCPTLSDLTDRSLPGSSIHGIFQARVLEWGAIAFSERPSTAVPHKTEQYWGKKQNKTKQLLWTSLRKTPFSPLMLNFHLDAYIISLPLKFSNFIKMCHSGFCIILSWH